MISVGWGQVNTLEQTLEELRAFPLAGGDVGEERTLGTIGSQFLGAGLRGVRRIGAKAEEAGYSHAWFVDSQILWQDCFVYMTHALARPSASSSAPP